MKRIQKYDFLMEWTFSWRLCVVAHEFVKIKTYLNRLFSHSRTTANGTGQKAVCLRTYIVVGVVLKSRW